MTQDNPTHAAHNASVSSASTTDGGNATKADASPPTAPVIQLRPPNRWHDPLQLIQNEPPSHIGRIVLWSVSLLVGILILWAAFGKLDIIASAEGKLVPQTLLKIVQPAESGVVKELLVIEGDLVKSGQLLARLDTTLASADKASIGDDLALQQLQVRRINAELLDQPLPFKAGDKPEAFAQIQRQYSAHRSAYLDSLEQEKSMLTKAMNDSKSANAVLAKLEQTLPSYNSTADAYKNLEKEGFMGKIASAEKQREALEKAKDLDAQRATVAALNATIDAQSKKVAQIRSNYHSELQKELADLHSKIAQLQPNLDKTIYREGLMELRAPQDGIIKDIATTTIGTVVQPGTVVMTLVPQDEHLYADVQIKNEDVGFIQVGQRTQLKLATYPFQRYGMLIGKVIHISADATETARPNNSSNSTKNGDNAPSPNNTSSDNTSATNIATYKARIELDKQQLITGDGRVLPITAGMQIVAEIHQGKRTVLEYMLSPVQKAVSEAARER